MKTNKLKLLPIAICSLVAALWSEAQCMDPPQIREDEPIRNHQTKTVPTGSIMSFAGEVAPHGWTLCDGRETDSKKHPELYEIIGTKYVPDREIGFVTQSNARHKKKIFYIPDLRGRVIVGVDGGAGRVMSNNTLGASSGEENHQITVPELPIHSHQKFDAITGSLAFPATAVLSGRNPNLLCSAFTENTGGDKPHNNMQPYQVLNYIICNGVIDSVEKQSKIRKKRETLFIRESRLDNCIKQIQKMNNNHLNYESLNNILVEVLEIYRNVRDKYNENKKEFLNSTNIITNANLMRMVFCDLQPQTCEVDKRFYWEQVQNFKAIIKYDVLKSMKLYKELHGVPHTRWDEFKTM
jgi:microcystin-dependent protein